MLVDKAIASSRRQQISPCLKIASEKLISSTQRYFPPKQDHFRQPDESRETQNRSIDPMNYLAKNYSDSGEGVMFDSDVTTGYLTLNSWCHIDLVLITCKLASVVFNKIPYLLSVDG